MKQRGSVHDAYIEREKGDREWGPVSREDRAQQRIQTIARAAEHWIAKAERTFAGVPGAEKILRAVREQARMIRAEAQEQILLAGLRYSKEYATHMRDALGAMVEEEAHVVDALLQDPRMFDKKLGEMIQSMIAAQQALKSEHIEKNQKAYYEKEIEDTQHIVYTVYLRNLRKEVQQGRKAQSPDKGKSVLMVREEIEKSGLLKQNDQAATTQKEELLKELLLAQDQRRADWNSAVNKRAQAVVLERLISGVYGTSKNRLKAAQKDFLDEVESDQGDSLGEFPPDMSFAYGALTFDKPDFLDQVERFLASETRKRRKT